MNEDTIRNRVGSIITNPFKLKRKLVPGLSIKKEIAIIEMVNGRIFHIIFLQSFRIRGNIRINNPKRIKKNWFPPHADKLKKKIIPDRVFRIIEFLVDLELSADKNNHSDNKLRNNPNGSDLNHPAEPRDKIGIEIENINAENNPAVVPKIFLKIPNKTKHVKEPIIAGKIIV
jgi:hypothetical protein